MATLCVSSGGYSLVTSSPLFLSLIHAGYSFSIHVGIRLSVIIDILTPF